MSDDPAAPSPTGWVIAPGLLADRMGCFMLFLLRLETCSVVPISGDGSSWERSGKNTRRADYKTTAVRCATPTRRRARESGRREKTTSPRHARHFTPTRRERPAALQ